MKKSLLAALATTFMVVGLAVPANSADSWLPVRDPSFVIDYEKGNDLVYVTEDWVHASSGLVWRDASNKYESCDDVGADKNCGKDRPGSVAGHALLPVCSDVIESCINKVWIYSKDSTSSEAIFSRTIYGDTFDGYPDTSVPKGDGSHVFTSDHRHSSGAGEYAVQAQIKFQTQNSSVRFGNIVVKITPVVERPHPGAKKTSYGICETNDGKGLAPCGDDGPSGCVYAYAGVCAHGQDFSPNTRVGIQLKLTNELTGWIRGRLQDPVIDIKPINKNYNLITVDALPVEISKFFTAASVAQGAPNILGKPSENAHGGGLTLFEAASKRALEIVKGYRDWTKDTSAGVTTTWTFASISGSEAGGSNANSYKCLNDKTRLLGLVTTNAMTYEGGAPSYSSGFLNYTLAGLHYMPDGKTEVLGTYDLVMRSDVARCLYNFSSAPVSATISVTGGDNNVATTVVSEKNGWLKLAAYGFTFSEKKVQVKLTQKKITITCVNLKNSKIIKKVTAYSPKCPTGYKKK